jgi:hypothetical protein
VIKSERLFRLLRKMLSLYSSKTAIVGVRDSGANEAVRAPQRRLREAAARTVPDERRDLEDTSAACREA